MNEISCVSKKKKKSLRAFNRMNEQEIETIKEI